jgi:L-serine dehydratase
MAEEMTLSEEDMAKALLASGLIGVSIATRWTFAAEVGGCQAEGGAVAAMAAAALVTLANGTLRQALAAASMAFQSILGLICDPVANRVEVPCLGKNVLAASNALSCANMALADYDPVIPFDEVVETAQRVTVAEPGLAIVWPAPCSFPAIVRNWALIMWNRFTTPCLAGRRNVGVTRPNSR